MKQMIFALIVGVASTSSPAVAQTADCNESSKSLLQAGGTGPSVSEECVKISFPGGSNQSPCIVGYRVTAANIYGCSGTLIGVHCNPFAYSILVSVYSGGGCPTLPDVGDLSIGSFGDLLRIPAAIVRSLVCVKPTVRSSKDDSATLGPCGGVVIPDPPPSEGALMVSTGTSQAVWAASPPGASSGQDYNPFLSWYEASENAAAAELPGILGSLAQAQAGLEGANLTGYVRLEHWLPFASDPESSTQIDVSGKLTLDGTFELQRVIPVTNTVGDPYAIRQVTYDGNILLDFQETAGVGNAHELDMLTPEWVRTDSLYELDALYNWLRDPYSIPMFQGLQTVESQQVSGSDESWIVQRYYDLDSGGTFLGEEYEVAKMGAVYFPVSRKAMDVNGALWVEDVFSEYFEIRAGDWRPGLLTQTWFLDGDPTGAKVVTTTKIYRATELDTVEANAVPTTVPQAPYWYHWLAY